MRVATLGLTTDLMLARWSSEVRDRGDHLEIRTPDQPDFWMGTTFVVPPPRPDERGAAWLAGWQVRFEATFPTAAHRSLLVDGDVGEDVERAIEAAGWKMQRNHALTARALRPVEPPDGVRLAAISEPAAWAQVTALAIASDEADAGPEAPVDDVHRSFLTERVRTKRAWIEAGRGMWWGAFAGDQLVGSLGVVEERELGRYQDVVTHPAWRRRGIASALLATAGRAMLARAARRLVIVAVDGGPALRLYRAAGFEPADVMVEMLRRPPSG